jgi:hypothetical protein
VITVCEEVLRPIDKMVHEIRDFLYYSKGTERCLMIHLGKPNVFGGQVETITFLRMYVLLDPNNFSISLARSRDISSDDMFAKVHNASPTAYMFEWFISLVE